MIQYVVMAGMATYSAYQSYSEGSKQKKLYAKQMSAMADAAEDEADRVRENAVKFSAEQKAQYLSSGVGFGGTALLVTQETRRLGEAEAVAIKKRAAAGLDYLGVESSMAQKRSSLNALTQGAQAVGYTAQAFNSSKQG